MNGSQIDHASTQGRIDFIILAQATIVVQPSEGAFHHPASGQHSKTLLLWGSRDNREDEVKRRRHTPQR